MNKSVKLAVAIYLGAILIVCGGYLIMILVGSVQGNDMRGSVLDADNTKIIENIDYNESATKKTSVKLNALPSTIELPNEVKTNIQQNTTASFSQPA